MTITIIRRGHAGLRSSLNNNTRNNETNLQTTENMLQRSLCLNLGTNDLKKKKGTLMGGGKSTEQLSNNPCTQTWNPFNVLYKRRSFCWNETCVWEIETIMVWKRDCARNHVVSRDFAWSCRAWCYLLGFATHQSSNELMKKNPMELNREFNHRNTHTHTHTHTHIYIYIYIYIYISLFLFSIFVAIFLEFCI